LDGVTEAEITTLARRSQDIVRMLDRQNMTISLIDLVQLGVSVPTAKQMLAYLHSQDQMPEIIYHLTPPEHQTFQNIVDFVVTYQTTPVYYISKQMGDEFLLTFSGCISVFESIRDHLVPKIVANFDATADATIDHYQLGKYIYALIGSKRGGLKVVLRFTQKPAIWELISRKLRAFMDAYEREVIHAHYDNLVRDRDEIVQKSAALFLQHFKPKTNLPLEGRLRRSPANVDARALTDSENYIMTHLDDLGATFGDILINCFSKIKGLNLSRVEQLSLLMDLVEDGHILAEKPQTSEFRNS
jgi:hypothetical protein